MSLAFAFRMYRPIHDVYEVIEKLKDSNWMGSSNVTALSEEFERFRVAAEEAYSVNPSQCPYDKDELDSLLARALEMKDLLERRAAGFRDLRPNMF